MIYSFSGNPTSEYLNKYFVEMIIHWHIKMMMMMLLEMVVVVDVHKSHRSLLNRRRHHVESWFSMSFILHWLAYEVHFV
jgi:hypothetical protein